MANDTVASETDPAVAAAVATTAASAQNDSGMARSESSSLPLATVGKRQRDDEISKGTWPNKKQDTNKTKSGSASMELQVLRSGGGAAAAAAAGGNASAGTESTATAAAAASGAVASKFSTAAAAVAAGVNNQGSTSASSSISQQRRSYSDTDATARARNPRHYQNSNNNNNRGNQIPPEWPNRRIVSRDSVWAAALEARQSSKESFNNAMNNASSGSGAGNVGGGGIGSTGDMKRNKSWNLLEEAGGSTINKQSSDTTNNIPGQITKESINALAAIAASAPACAMSLKQQQNQQQQQKEESKLPSSSIPTTSSCATTTSNAKNAKESSAGTSTEQQQEVSHHPPSSGGTASAHRVSTPQSDIQKAASATSSAPRPEGEHYLPGPLKAIIESSHTITGASDIHEEGTISVNIEQSNIFFSTRNISIMDRAFMIMSLFALCTWIGLLYVIYIVTPEENYGYVGYIEHYTAIFAASLIFGSMLTKITPLVIKSGANIFGSGLIVGAIIVQLIASLTDIFMALCKTPIMIDPVTGARTYPLRYCEWTVLAFMMTFFTEGVQVPQEDPSSKPPSTTMEKIKHVWSIVRWPFLMGASQGLSTVAGLIFPFCPDFFTWSVWMIESCVLYLALFPRLMHKRKEFLGMDKGNSVDEVEIYDRVRLSYRLMTTCAVMWTVLVFAYFFGSFSWWFVPDGSVLRLPCLSFVCDCIIDVLAKALYMDVIVDVHKLVFDDRERTARRLEELRKLMSVVWECSSDVISISVKGQNGVITTMLSPTFHNIDNIFMKECLDNAANGETETERERRVANMKSKPIVFEMKERTTPTKVGRPDSTNTEDNTMNDPIGNDNSIHSFINQDGDSARNENDDVDIAAVYAVDICDGGQMFYHDRDLTAENHPSLFSIQKLMAKSWACEKSESLLVHDIHLRNGDVVQCEAKSTRLGPNALVVVMRDISERFMCFEAEKRAVSESTARQKDAEANRFTRHEVKNGLLASIGLCDSLREVVDHENTAIVAAAGGNSNSNTAAQVSAFKYISDLDSTLRDILDTVLAEAMARDVIHEVYEPKMERVDLVSVLSGVQGKDNRKRFPVVTNPSPLPIFLFDPQLLKYIHRNAVSNACKYGKKRGVVITEVSFDSVKNEVEVNVINLPGENHSNLVKLGRSANDAVFAPGKRLHSNVDLFGSKQQMKHSSGDGAWISRKCAKTLGGDCSIRFEPEKTVFTLKCPARPYDFVLKLFPGAVGDPSNFRLPEDTWGVAIDDSKIQRKLMKRFFSVAGIPTDRQVLLGENADEIRSFTDIIERLLKEHPTSYFLVIADENLDIVEDSNHCHTISGSLCIQKLRRQLDKDKEHRMLALVRSANDSASDVAIYNSRAHGFICKAPIQREKIMEIIAPIWAKRFAQRFPHSITKRDRLKSDVGDAVLDPAHRFDADANMSASMEILQTLEVIDALCIKNQSALDMRWPVLWEKLTSLQDDLIRLEAGQANGAINDINGLEGPQLPDDFLTKWSEIRSKIIRII